MNRLAILGAVFAVAATAVGCGSGAGNKVGAATHTTRTLTFEVPDDGDPAAAVFAKAVSDRTHGRVHVRHDLASPYSSVVPANEVRLAHALESGDVAVGYVPARAWAAVGIPEFQVLLAPFVLTTQDASAALAQSSLARAILQGLPHSVVGLGLVPQEPRRILATRPPTSTAALRGLRIRIIDNRQTAADLRAVGARPIQRVDAHRTAALLQSHSLDGVESNTSSILVNGYQSFAHYFSTYSPFAKFQTIVVSRQTWDTLTPSQRAALRTAARDAVSSAASLVPFEESEELRDLCQADARPARPTRAQLEAIAAAMGAASARILTSPSHRELLTRLLALPGTGVHALATPLPEECLHPPTRPPFVHRGGPTIPTGVYTVTDTVADFKRGNVINPDFLKPITYVTTIRNDGTWSQTQSPNYPDQGPFSGTYTVHGDQVVFVMKCAGTHCQNSHAAPETCKWSYFAGKLTFQSLIVSDPASRVLYEAHPWQKIR
jgi:TRAP-type C4-dicarboxylate transport system substrate-binding protein